MLSLVAIHLRAAISAFGHCISFSHDLDQTLARRRVLHHLPLELTDLVQLADRFLLILMHLQLLVPVFNL